MDGSLRGRQQLGSLPQSSPFSTNLSVQVMWYDIAADQHYYLDFDLDVRDLSTLGDATDQDTPGASASRQAAATSNGAFRAGWPVRPAPRGLRRARAKVWTGRAI